MFTRNSVQTSLLFLSLVAPRAALGALYLSADDAYKAINKTKYDYIIVGGESA